jgi:pimeloyl-ACP methyl ester carboxylesterase
MTPKNDAFAGKSPRPGALPPPDPAFVAGVIAVNATAPRSDAEAVTQLVDNFRLAKGPVSPFDERYWQDVMRRFVERPQSRPDGRSAKVANHGNHARAQAATPPLSSEDLGRISAPVLILHGTHDPIFPPAHARWAAEVIPGARLRFVEGMGHALDPAFFAEVTQAIVEHAAGR